MLYILLSKDLKKTLILRFTIYHFIFFLFPRNINNNYIFTFVFIVFLKIGKEKIFFSRDKFCDSL